MLISKKWLSQYMDVSDLSIEEIAERITNAGLEVEGIEKGAQATNLVIGHIESCVDHPDSDHLHVCQVNVGTDTRQIVCGAPNVAAGQKVIVSLPAQNCRAAKSGRRHPRPGKQRYDLFAAGTGRRCEKSDRQAEGRHRGAR